MPRARVLVVEDDRAIREGLVDALAFHGYSAVQAERGDVGLEKALHGGCDLVILDLVLPGTEGLAVLRELRRARPTLPVIILTARGGEADKVRGLAEGADDYVAKPFSIRELLARVARRHPRRGPAPGPGGPRSPGGGLRGRDPLRPFAAGGGAAALSGRQS